MKYRGHKTDELLVVGEYMAIFFFADIVVNMRSVFVNK
jgi:hypothetical protein